MKRTILLIMGMVCAMLSAQAQAAPHHKITGKVLSAKGNPLAGASLFFKKNGINTVSDALGRFSITVSALPDTLIISRLGYRRKQVFVQSTPESDLVIRLEPSGTALQEVTVSTGYQHIPKERATGSFDFIDNKLLNRNVSSNIIDRIENLAPGLLINHGDAVNTDPLLIRGRSTIYGNAAPLIVVDNFPYDGDINNINPNDVESITILKDAAAASIWGARAGNGVIVITTKKGKTARPRVAFTADITSTQRPDLFNINQISPSDYIELEKYLYDKGYYQAALGPNNTSPVTPVVALMLAKDAGTISSKKADAMIESMKNHDVRSDIEKYLYRKGFTAQYALNVSGKTNYINYYMSAGWDRSLPVLAGQRNDRLTLRSKNTFHITRDLSIDAGISFTQGINKSGNNPGYFIRGSKSIYPYAKLADDNGNPLPVNLYYNQDFMDKATQDGLLNWKYKPIDEIKATKNETRTRDYKINVGIHYSILKSLNFELKYQYENQIYNISELHTDSSYYTRDLINKFTQVDPGDHSLSYPIPQGGIMDARVSEMISHQGRAQLNYNKTWNEKHQLTALAGMEIRSIVSTGDLHRVYGYRPDISSTKTDIDFTMYYPQYDNSSVKRQISNQATISKGTNHFLSYYANASYTFNDKYTISASARKDEANLFGVAANKKGTPLWSGGISWALSNEGFYNISWLPFLKFRLTYGSNGNISRRASAFATIKYNGPSAYLVNPPNEDLEWERVNILNAGMDFSLLNSALSGTLEYYHKTGTNIMAETPVDPTSGVVDFYGNVAGTNGKGFDLQLHTQILNKEFKWQNDIIFSYAKSTVTKYSPPQSDIGNIYLYVGHNSINPVVGKPVFAYYSYAWGGLDPTSGDPIGYLHGQSSKDYVSIYSQTPLDSMIYNGPAEPVYFGSFRNTFTWKNLSLSFNISYKLSYFFRTTSVNYSTLFGSWTGSGDYPLRWQKPGDEKRTHIPSLVYPADNYRDAFYSNAEVLVKNAGNIRLEDVKIMYDLTSQQIKGLPFSQVQLYLYASNLATLWVDNDENIDPYYGNGPRFGKQFSIGFHFTF